MTAPSVVLWTRQAFCSGVPFRDAAFLLSLPASLGGVVSTYVNAIGDAFQSVLGFAGTTQWAAGLHVLWLTLAVGLTGKQGAGTIVLFAGLLARGLLGALRRAGVVRDRAPVAMGRWARTAFLVGSGVLAVALGLYLRQALRGPATVHIGGAVEAPYDYPTEHGDIAEVTAEATLRNVTTRYTGAPLRALIDHAEPLAGASLLLVQATDGYAFFIAMDELQRNAALLLACQGRGDDASCDVVGPENSKAWVRGVSQITVVGAATLPVSGALDRPAAYDPDDWQFEMDSTRLDVGQGAAKYQGVPLGQVLQAMEPSAQAQTVVAYTDAEPVSLPLAEVLGDDDLRIFTIIGDQDVSFALGRMSGQVLAPRLVRIEVREP